MFNIDLVFHESNALDKMPLYEMDTKLNKTDYIKDMIKLYKYLKL